MNPYERLARERKAQAIALTVSGHLAAEQLEALTERQRARLAQACGQREPSTATWQRVVQLVQAFERRPKVDDPFAGISEADEVANERARRAA